jgi:hypothetical protein
VDEVFAPEIADNFCGLIPEYTFRGLKPLLYPWSAASFAGERDEESPPDPYDETDTEYPVAATGAEIIRMLMRMHADSTRYFLSNIFSSNITLSFAY